MPLNQPLTFAVLGAGGRGGNFSRWLKSHPEYGSIVAIAEPNQKKRKAIADLFSLPADRQFENWEDFARQPRIADAVINTTMDRLHAPSAIPLLAKGYHMLLEKPMATTLEDCVAIDKARQAAGTVVSVCHSLRYHLAYREIKRLLTAGAIGRLISFDQLEGVEYIHQSHSFVRGNWGNQGRSTFMLMSKSCHDMDIMAYLAGKPCRRVSSFGSLTYFTKANAPKGAPLTCVEGCPAERECIYSAIKLYAAKDSPWAGWASMTDLPFEERMEILKTSPYGRCVFQTDNDVVDHQVVAMEFDSDITATFTMTAFAPGGRKIRLHGTEGYLVAEVESNNIEVTRFSDGAKLKTVIPPQSGGHGGADDNVMRELCHAIWSNNPDAVLTTTAQSLETHKIAFASERARLEKRVVELSELA